jgi:hypothetical protein
VNTLKQLFALCYHGVSKALFWSMVSLLVAMPDMDAFQCGFPFGFIVVRPTAGIMTMHYIKPWMLFGDTVFYFVIYLLIKRKQQKSLLGIEN